MGNLKELKRITLAATLTALSIVLDITFKTIIPSGLDRIFGFPYYSIPLVIGSLILGPIYGGAMGYISDLVGFYASGYPQYEPLFALSAIAWGVLPWLLTKVVSKWPKVLLAIFVSHLSASALNTLSMYISYGAETAFGSLGLRLAMMPVNVIIITVTTYLILQRLNPVFEDYMKPQKLI
jgi:ECF transporter S component (folate family)